MCANLSVIRGKVRSNQGKHKEAYEDIEGAARLDPTSASVRFEFGKIRYYTGRVKEAIEDLTASLQSNPNSHEGWSLLGDAHAGLSMSEAAAAAYTQVIRLTPQDTAVVLKRAAIWAKVPGAGGRGESIEVAALACERGGWKEPAALVSLAVAHAERGGYGEAVKWLSKALSLPDFAPTHGVETRKLLLAYQEFLVKGLRRR